MIFAQDLPFAVMVLDLDAAGEHVHDGYVVSNPDKLASLSDHDDE
ncbi:hypothetical protein AB0K48_14515 [Nonomuraea sp. NPDC055795]